MCYWVMEIFIKCFMSPYTNIAYNCKAIVKLNTQPSSNQTLLGATKRNIFTTKCFQIVSSHSHHPNEILTIPITVFLL